jgi:hypothetical protein
VSQQSIQSAISPSIGHLRDLILAEVRSRGVMLEEYALRIEQEHPVLRFKLRDRVLWGCWVRLPGDPTRPYAVDVITVHGCGHRASKMWPRRVDASFNIPAIAEHVVRLVEEEVSRSSLRLEVPAGLPSSASGLHVLHLAAVQLGALAVSSVADDLLDRVEDARVRERARAHLRRGGLTDTDLRALGDAAGLLVGRAIGLDVPHRLEPINALILTALKIGERRDTRIDRRYVLIVEHRGDAIELADPAGQGRALVAPDDLERAWLLGAKDGRPWFGTISAR